MKAIYRLIIGMHLFVGIGGMAGGLAAVMNPVNPLGAPSDMMKIGPFRDYFIPGLTLLIVIGLGNVVVGILAIKKAKFHGIASGGMGAILIGWIVIQCVILQTVSSLHVIFLLIGVLQGLSALILLYRLNEFPINLARKLLGLSRDH